MATVECRRKFPRFCHRISIGTTSRICCQLHERYCLVVIFNLTSLLGVTEYVKLTSDQGPVGVVHLLPTGNSSFTAKIKLSTLRCRQKVIQDHACKFELNAAHDKIGVATSGANELSFSFQTDKPTSGLLRLQSSSADLTVRIEGRDKFNSN